MRPARDYALRGCEILVPRTLKLWNFRIATSPDVWMRALYRGWNLLRWAASGRKRGSRPEFPNTLGQPPKRQDRSLTIKAVNANPPLLLIAEYSSMAPILDACLADYRAVLLHDVFSLRAESFRRANLSPDHAPISLTTEASWLEAADLCIYASAKEARLLNKKLPEKQHIWLPPAVRRKASSDEGPPRAVFIGVRHAGNRDALNFLLQDIWPRTHAARPGAELLIVGEIGAEVHNAPSGVRVLGRVKDLSTIGGTSSIGLAPTRAGSGASIKIVTYLENGMSVLASSKALEGYDGALDGLVERADTAHDFSDKLINLLANHDYRETTAQHGACMISESIDNIELDRTLRRIARGSIAPIALPLRSHQTPTRS